MTPRRSAPSTPVASTSKRASSRTPSSSAHHHKTADELAAEEAASLLHTPLSKLVEADVLDGDSARALRHKRLNALKVSQEQSEGSQSDDGSERSAPSRQIGKTVSIESIDDDEAFTTTHEATASEAALASTLIGGSHGLKDIEVLFPEAATVREEQLDTTDRTGVRAGLSQLGDEEPSSHGSPAEVPALAAILPSHTQSQSGSDSDSEDDTDSEDDSSDASSGTDTSSEEDDDAGSDEEEERMGKLLQAARTAALAKAQINAAKVDDDGTVLQFDVEESGGRKEMPIPDLSVPKLPQAHLSFNQEGRASARPQVPSTSQAGPSRPRSPTSSRNAAASTAPELDIRPYERELSKKEKKAQPRKATVSELWATIPTPRADLLPDMKRDYQALALANSLDPKRFMKGGSRSDKVPGAFAIGTMIDAPRHLQDTTLAKERKYRAGQVVKELIQDEDTGAYAKRKYGDLQWSKMENGRGKGWKKRTKW